MKSNINNNTKFAKEINGSLIPKVQDYSKLCKDIEQARVARLADQYNLKQVLIARILAKWPHLKDSRKSILSKLDKEKQLLIKENALKAKAANDSRVKEKYEKSLTAEQKKKRDEENKRFNESRLRIAQRRADRRMLKLQQKLTNLKENFEACKTVDLEFNKSKVAA